MIKYSAFNTTDDHSYNVYNAILYCIMNNENGIIFDKGRYDFYADRASEDVLHVSNHDIYGIVRIAFLIKGIKNFTVDGGGSEFVFHDALIPFAIVNSENITLKNFSIDYDETMTLDLKVYNIGKEYFDAAVCNDDGYCISDSMLYCCDSAGNKDIFHYLGIRAMEGSKSFIPESKDIFRIFKPEIRFEDLGNKKIRAYNTGLSVKEGMHLIARGKNRYACNIISAESKDVSLVSITMYHSYAMGVLAQKTENVTIDDMTVKAKEDSLYSLNCDATHFVHCKGSVKVTNSSFSEQQDDALNIHGIFTKITDKTEKYILVKYMHKSAKGINIYEKGSVISVLNPKTLISRNTYRIQAAEVINMNYTKIYIEGGTDNILIGDVVEDLSWSCDLLFENNKVINNRARGILVAAKGRVEIKNNYFSTPGVAILFESDGQMWFESGGTTDVRISKNRFENCCYTKGNWGSHTIEFKPREECDDEEYYHRYIEISDNSFKRNSNRLIYADNIKKLVIKNNDIDAPSTVKDIEVVNCGDLETDTDAASVK